jgi:hypothetical protein
MRTANSYRKIRRSKADQSRKAGTKEDRKGK